jgi:hypothetical protein
VTLVTLADVILLMAWSVRISVKVREDGSVRASLLEQNKEFGVGQGTETNVAISEENARRMGLPKSREGLSSSRRSSTRNEGLERVRGEVVRTLGGTTTWQLSS